jgi:hypothetical protein
MNRKHVVVVVAMSFVATAGWTGLAAGEVPRQAEAGGGASGPNPVIAWNEHAGSAALAACIAPGNDPPHEARLYAMTHIAIHDALNAIDLRSRPYAFAPSHEVPWASADAAVAAAAHEVMVPVLKDLPFPQDCIDAGVASVEADYASAVAAIPDGRAKTAGIELGAAAAAAVVALRSADGSDTPLQDFDYPQGTRPGEYRFTPGFDPGFVLLPHWGDVTPFVLTSSSQFLPPPPYSVTSKKYAADLDEVKRLGSDSAQSPRTADQTQIARFWLESSPLAWNRITRTVAIDRQLDSWESARLFGLLDMAMADGYIASFHVKFDVYKYWRPVTAIRAAGTDGNPETAEDLTWTPLETTPPIPDYDSGHSVEGGVAAAVLERFFGTDHVSFTACSYTLPDPSDACTGSSPVLRSYNSFSQAATENGESRILVGFHFRHAVEVGIRHGERIGDRVVSRVLRPVHGDGSDR